MRRSTPRTGPLGLPRPISGAFAAVFPMTTPEGATYAAKCFLSGSTDRRARYRAVANHLAEAALPYTVGFEYQPEGVRVGGHAFPLLKMEWAEGAPLNRYAEEHLDAPEALDALAEAWAEMLAALEAADFAHGDLQHGNALVQSGGGGPRLILVDYDTAYVPALDGEKSAEVGHRNYQHPDRTEDDFGPALDRFAGLAVFVALRALSRQPGLWQKYDTGENLLFRAADFYDPDASPLFAELAEVSGIETEVNALRAACHLAPEDVPSLADVRSGSAPIEAASPSARRRRQRAPREGLARWAAPVCAGSVAVAALLAAAGQVAAALLLLAACAGVGAVTATRGYRRQPVVRRRRRLRQEAARFAERVGNLKREAEALSEQRERIASERDARRAERLDEVREEALRDRLKHHFIGEARAVEGLSHKTVVRLKAAGIRTAFEATPEALAAVTKLGDKSTARLNQWRAALAARYADALPEALSPAEARRLKRRTERRLEQIDAEAARTRRKIETQRAERADAEARAGALPPLSPARYLRYLLRLDATLPSPEEAPAPPPAAPEPEALPAPENDAPGEGKPAEREDAAWYE